jgi:hypothetical protein
VLWRRAANQRGTQTRWSRAKRSRKRNTHMGLMGESAQRSNLGERESALLEHSSSTLSSTLHQIGMRRKPDRSSETSQERQ